MLGPHRSLVIGMSLMAAAFAPLAIVPGKSSLGVTAAVVALFLSAALVAVGTAAVFPFEMDTVVALSGGRLVATHYGFYNTVVGFGILLGNLGTGAVFGSLQAAQLGSVIWVVLIAIGVACTAALYWLERSGRLEPAPPDSASPRPASQLRR